MQYLPSKKFGISVAAIVAAGLLVAGADAASHLRVFAPGLAVAGQIAPSQFGGGGNTNIASSTASAWPNDTPVSSIINPATDSTKTAELSQDLASRYVAAAQANGGTLTEAQYAQIAQQTVSDNAGNLLTVKTYTPGNVIAGTDDSDAALTAYGNAMGTVIENSVASVANTQDEEVLALTAMQNDDPAVLTQINPRITAYQNIIAGFLKISPPPSLATLHLSLINDFSTLVAIDQGLKLEFTDSAVALAALGRYQSALNQLNSDFSAVGALYRQRKISFSKNQSGYLFANLQTPQ